MPRRKFVPYDAIGCTAWAVIVTLIGYWFGGKIPDIDRYILIAVAAVMLITLGPSVWHDAQSGPPKIRAQESGEKTDE